MTIINVSRSFFPVFLLAGSSDFERGLAKMMTSMQTAAKMPSATWKLPSIKTHAIKSTRLIFRKIFDRFTINTPLEHLIRKT